MCHSTCRKTKPHNGRGKKSTPYKEYKLLVSLKRDVTDSFSLNHHSALLLRPDPRISSVPDNFSHSDPELKTIVDVVHKRAKIKKV